MTQDKDADLIRDMLRDARIIGGEVGYNLERAAARIAELTQELETERMRLAACGVIAMANTRETAAKARKMHPDYRSASANDVADAVDREMALREKVEELTQPAPQPDAQAYPLPQHLNVTTHKDGTILAVTVNDSDGRVVQVLAEAPKPAPLALSKEDAQTWDVMVNEAQFLNYIKTPYDRAILAVDKLLRQRVTPCPTCEALARTVMMDQTGRA